VGCSKFPTYIYYSAHEIPIAAQSRQGHASSFIKHSYTRVHNRLLARQIHNTHNLPTAAASRPARLRRSLPAAALLFSSPTAPYVMTVTRTQLLACRRTSHQPKDGWRGSVDVIPGHDDEPAGRLRPRGAVNPAPPTIMRTTTSFATKVSPAWTLNALSLIGHQNWSTIYSCQCGLIRETCLDSSSLIDWLWFWLMDFVTPSLFWINCC
jgi:hypothetical protein